MRADWMNEGKRNVFKNFYRRWFYKLIYANYLSDCESFLDVACGRGLFLDCLPKDKGRVGIDLEIPADAFDFERHKLDYKNWQESMDCVFSSQFIEHVNGAEFIKWATSIARKKIVIITGRPSASFWDDPSHIRPYTKKAVRCLLEENNWKISLNINLYPTQGHITIGERRKDGKKISAV